MVTLKGSNKICVIGHKLLIAVLKLLPTKLKVESDHRYWFEVKNFKQRGIYFKERRDLCRDAIYFVQMRLIASLQNKSRL